MNRAEKQRFSRCRPRSPSLASTPARPCTWRNQQSPATPRPPLGLEMGTTSRSHLPRCLAPWAGRSWALPKLSFQGALQASSLLIRREMPPEQPARKAASRSPRRMVDLGSALRFPPPPVRKARAGSQKMTSTGLPGNSPERVLLMPPQLLPEGFPRQGLASLCKNQDEAAPWRP